MTFDNNHWLFQQNKMRKLVFVLLVAVAASFLVVPEAQALSCSSTFADVVGERVQLKACDHDFSNSNGDDNANFQFAGGVTVAVGDLMLVTLAIDGNNTNLNPPAGWTQLQVRLSGGDQSSNVWTKVADAADVLKPSYQFTWAGGNEKNQGYLLLFTGTSGLFNFVSAVQGNDTTPNSPAITPNSAFNLILRMANIDQSSVDSAAQGPGMPGHTDLIQAENTGNAGNSRVSISGAFTHQTGTGSTAPPNYNFVSSNEGSHVRTLSIEPYEFRFSMPDTTASICGAQLVTLSVTDRLGNPVTSFAGTVSLSATNSGSAIWADGGALNGPLIDSGSGSATYTFVSGDGGVAVFEYHNPIVNLVNFGLSYNSGGSVFSENPSFDPTLTVDNLCEFRIVYTDGSMGSCSSEQMSISLFDSSGVAATHYTGTIDIVNDQADGDYTPIGENGTFDTERQTMAPRTISMR